MNKIIKQLSFEFCEEVDLLYLFNKTKWFQGAYATMQRTKKGGTPKEIREKLKDYTFEQIGRLKDIQPTRDSFNQWFYDNVKIICKMGQLTFGQGQKIINILLKYHYCYYYSQFNLE